MYIPKNMEISDKEAIADFISRFSFGTLLSKNLDTTRLPLLYKPSGDNSGEIIGHMARANPQWKNLSGEEVAVLFDGPHSYISPTWYRSKPNVPTWNYASIKCYGVFSLLSEEETILAVNDIVAKYEPALLQDKSTMPDDYQEKLIKGIVGFKVSINKIAAKEKLGQNKRADDQKSVYEALVTSSNTDAKSLADYMQYRGFGIDEN